MATHRITLTLSDAAYERLQQIRESRQLDSEDEVVEQALAEMEGERGAFSSGADLDAWIRDVVIPADDEYLADPSGACTLEEFEQAFWQRHGVKRIA